MSRIKERSLNGLRRRLKVTDIWRRFTGKPFPINPTVQDLGEMFQRIATDMFGDNFINPTELVCKYDDDEHWPKLYQGFLTMVALASLPREQVFIVPGPPENSTLMSLWKDKNFQLSRQNLQLYKDGDRSRISYILNVEDLPSCTWMVFLKQGIPGTEGKSLQKQFGVASNHLPFRPGTAVETYYCLSQYLRVRKENPLGRNLMLRTSSVSSNGQNVFVKSQGRNRFMLADLRDNKEMHQNIRMSGVWVYDSPKSLE